MSWNQFPGVLNWRRELVLLEPTWGTSGPPTETNQLGPFFVRISFRAFGRNPYLRNTAQDLDAPPPPVDAGISPAFLVRLPLKGFWSSYRRRPQLGWHDDDGLSVVQDTGGSIQVLRSLETWSLARASGYLYRGTAQDFDAPAAEEPSTFAAFLVRLPFRGLGLNPYLRNTANDLSFVEPLDLPSFLDKPQYKALGRNPYLWNTAQDLSFTTPAEADTWIPSMVRLNIQGRFRVVPAYILLTRSAQDEDAPGVPPGIDDYTQRHHHFYP